MFRFWKSALPLEGLEEAVGNLTLDGVPIDTTDTGRGKSSTADGVDLERRMDETRTQTFAAQDVVDQEGAETVDLAAALESGVSADEDDGGSFGVAKELKTARAEQLTAAEMEESRKFAIKSVVNPTDGSEVSLQQAIVLGIIQPEEGVYVNPATGDKKPIASAMSDGLIKVHMHALMC